MSVVRHWKMITQPTNTTNQYFSTLCKNEIKIKLKQVSLKIKGNYKEQLKCTIKPKYNQGRREKEKKKIQTIQERRCNKQTWEWGIQRHNQQCAKRGGGKEERVCSVCGVTPSESGDMQQMPSRIYKHLKKQLQDFSLLSIFFTQHQAVSRCKNISLKKFLETEQITKVFYFLSLTYLHYSLK